MGNAQGPTWANHGRLFFRQLPEDGIDHPKGDLRTDGDQDARFFVHFEFGDFRRFEFHHRPGRLRHGGDVFDLQPRFEIRLPLIEAGDRWRRRRFRNGAS